MTTPDPAPKTSWLGRILGPAAVAAINNVGSKIVDEVKTEIRAYAPQLIALAKGEFEQYMPQLIALAREQLDKYGPDLIALAREEIEKYGPELLGMAKEEFHTLFDQWFPILLTGLSKTAVDTAVKMADHTVDDLVKMTPTELDDKIISPVAKGVIGWLGAVFSGALVPPVQQGP